MQKFFFTMSIFVGSVTMAQQPSNSIWMSLQIPVTIGKWQWHNDAGYRTIGLSQSAYQYLYRTGGRYIFSKKWSSAAGIAFFYTRASYQKANHGFGREFRLWQELNYNENIGGRFTLQNRVRTEERWFDAVQNKPSYKAIRFRYRIAGTQRLSDRWGIQLADEYMQQVQKKKISFDQNRLIATVICTVSESTQINGGYMWLLRTAGSQHVMVITFQKGISVHGNKDKHSSK